MTNSPLLELTTLQLAWYRVSAVLWSLTDNVEWETENMDFFSKEQRAEGYDKAILSYFLTFSAVNDLLV